MIAHLSPAFIAQPSVVTDPDAPVFNVCDLSISQAFQAGWAGSPTDPYEQIKVVWTGGNGTSYTYTLSILDSTGVVALSEQVTSAGGIYGIGTHEHFFNAGNLPTGTYRVRIRYQRAAQSGDFETCQADSLAFDFSQN